MAKVGHFPGDDKIFDGELITASDNRFDDDVLGQQWDTFEKFRRESVAGEAGFTIWIYEIPCDTAGNPAPGAQSVNLFTAPIDRYTLAQIFERCKKDYMQRGPGQMVIRIMVRKTSGEAGVHFNKLFIIKKSAADDGPEVENTKSGAEIVALTNMVERLMANQQQMMREFLMRQSAAPAVPSRDPVSTAIEMVTAMSGMMAALNRSAVAPVTGGGIVEQISAFREMMNLTREFAGDGDGGIGGGGDGGPVEILKAVGPIASLIGDLVKANTSRPQSGPHVQRRLAAPTPTPTPAPTPTPEPPAAPRPISQGETPMFMQVSKSLGELVVLAKTGGDPVALAPTIIASMPEAYDEIFYGIISAENWLDRLASFNGSVKESPEVIEWMNRLRAALLAEYTDESEPGASPQA